MAARLDAESLIAVLRFYMMQVVGAIPFSATTMTNVPKPRNLSGGTDFLRLLGVIAS